MFTLENFVADCRATVENDPSHLSIAELTRSVFADPAAVLSELGEPTEGGLNPIYMSDNMTIANVVWRPGMTVMPHNHNMWAVIAIYGGREDNIFWRRIKDDPDGRIEAAGAQALTTGDVCPFGKDIIHSVNNPIPKLTGAIHIYGGDFFGAHVSEWDAEDLTEHDRDMNKVKAMFTG